MKNNTAKRKNCKSVNVNGFTLVELMVIIAVVGLLLMLSYSNNQPLFKLDRESQAKAFLLEVSSRQSNFWQQHKIYANNLSELKMRVPESLQSFYRIELLMLVSLSNQPGYLVKAIPVVDDVASKTLWINNLGTYSSNWAF